MRYKNLGKTSLKVSLIGLGTMTFGEQNTEQDAFAQLDVAVARGVNLIDTAEMYPVPPKAETQGLTETYIGNWLSNRGGRDKLVIATKAAGPVGGTRPGHIRGGNTRLDKKNLTQALHDSLRRLQTDYIDLYQLHWPDRTTNTFGQLGYPWPPEETSVPIEESLQVLDDFVKAGKVRYVGVSNETPWGVSQYLRYSREQNLVRIASIQNPYSLLNRSFEVGLSEVSRFEAVSLLAYSPLAFGVLTGKYLHRQRPANARLSLFERFTRYSSEGVDAAVAEYVVLAREIGVTPAQLALAFVNQQPFVASNLIGATSVPQLEENLSSLDIQLNAEAISAINRIHLQNPNPAP